MSNKIERLQKLKQMLDDDTLSEEEYQKMKAEIVEEENSNTSNTSKTEKLANKRIWISTLLGILIPIGAYIYTWRWKPFLYLMGTAIALGFLVGVVTPNHEKAFKRSFRLNQILGIVVATIDNGRAISRARTETKGKSNED